MCAQVFLFLAKRPTFCFVFSGSHWRLKGQLVVRPESHRQPNEGASFDSDFSLAQNSCFSELTSVSQTVTGSATSIATLFGSLS